MVRAKTTLPLLTATLLLAGTFGFTREAHAQREILTAMGSKGTLAIDQLSGFRVSSLGGVSYAGPIGFSTQSVGETLTNTKQTDHFTSFWIAPSADYFLIDHLSLGGLFEVISTSHSQDVQALNNGTTVTNQFAGLTSITFIPRVGWLFAINDRFGIWPRGGIGYASRQIAVGQNDHDTLSGFVFDVDVGFLYRVNESFFLKAAPEITFGLGPSHARTVGNTTFSNDASLFQFAGVAGIGVMWDL